MSTASPKPPDANRTVSNKRKLSSDDAASPVLRRLPLTEPGESKTTGHKAGASSTVTLEERARPSTRSSLTSTAKETLQNGHADAENMRRSEGESPALVAQKEEAVEEGQSRREANGCPPDFQTLGKEEFCQRLGQLVSEKKFRTKHPVIGGKPIDPYMLYMEVCRRGGPDNVTATKEWAELSRLMKPPKSHSSASFATKTAYYKFIHPIVADHLPDAAGATTSGRKGRQGHGKAVRPQKREAKAPRAWEYPQDVLKLERMARTKLQLPTWSSKALKPTQTTDGDDSERSVVEIDHRTAQEQLRLEDKFFADGLLWLRRSAATAGLAAVEDYSKETNFNFKLLCLRTRASLNCGKLPLRYRKGPSRWMGTLGSSRRRSWWKDTQPRVGPSFQVDTLPLPTLGPLFGRGTPVESAKSLDTDMKDDDRERLVALEIANMKALSGEKVYVGNTESAAFEPMVVAEDVYAGDDWEDNYEERRRQTAKAVGDFDGALRDSGIAYNLKWTGGTIDSDLNKEDQVKFKEGLEEYGRDFLRIRKNFLPEHSISSLVSYYYNFWKPMNMKWRLQKGQSDEMDTDEETSADNE